MVYNFIEIVALFSKYTIINLKLFSMNPVCIIGIDGGTFKVIEPLCRSGSLRAISNLINEGKKFELITTIPPLTPSAWSSFLTGKNPGKHGILDFYELDENFEYRLSSFKLRKQKKIWNILSERKLKSIIYFVPFTYPPERVNGIFVSGFLTPSINSEFTYPLEFKNELLKRFPNYRITENIKFSKKNSYKFFEDLVELTDLHGDVMEYLIKNKEFDFFLGVFMTVDHVQHWLWDDKEKVEFIYKKIDEKIEKIISIMPEGSLFVIMSDHGFQDLKGHFYVNSFLLKEKFLKLKKGLKNSFKLFMYKSGFSPLRLSKIVYRLGLENLLRRDKESFGKTASKIGFSYADIDFEKTYAFGFGYYGFIFINERGRFPFGIVNKNEKERIAEDIKSSLLDLSREFKINIKIFYKEELYSGDNLYLMPDIVYSFDDFSYVSSWVAFPDFNFFGPSMTEKTGDHDTKGIFIIWQKGRKLNIKGDKTASIVDIFPTVLKFFNIEIPSDLDGKSLL
ncbi:MAG: alkaline phosphatase family protein [Candidatus Hydrothermales bacterium]